MDDRWTTEKKENFKEKKTINNKKETIDVQINQKIKTAMACEPPEENKFWIKFH